MPCNSEYMEATGKERAMSQVACLLDELAGNPIDKSHWRGYHPRIYNQHNDTDALVAELCEKLQQIDIAKHSFEMQMWWRDHQEADKKRLEGEIRERQVDIDAARGLEKLTDAERQALGL